jgi:hypothetical protein|tara:strand:+ start:266 stop:691 length:426 start_codon:yes stop_codon:yes gene_type:complete
MEDRQQTTSVYREEVFGTLTYKNGIKFVKMMELVGIFLKHLAQATKTHPKIEWAYESGNNLHIHFILLVMDDERAKFNERYKHWKSWKSWRFKIELLEPYIQGLRSYEYLDAHTRAPSFVVCPKSYSRCRKGNCEHTENDG